MSQSQGDDFQFTKKPHDVITKSLKMKMDPVRKGLPSSPLKPPLLPKPKYISKDPPIWLTKTRSEKKSSLSVELNESHTSIKKSLFVTEHSAADTCLPSPVWNSDSFSQSEEEFSSFSSPISYSDKSSLYLDCSSISTTLDQSYKDDYHIDNQRSCPSTPVRRRFIHNYEEISEIFAENPTFHLTANLRNQNNEKHILNPIKISSTSPCNDSLSSDSTFNSEDNGSQASNEIKINAGQNKAPKETKAYLIAKELMTSEEVYVNALKLLLIEFKSFLTEYSSSNNVTVIPPQELDKIFKTLPQLLHLNEDLLNDMQVRINEWEQRQKIADVIVKKGPFLKLYTTYMKDFESQCNYIDDCCQKYPKFSKALREFESFPICKKLTLRHYMLKPVQRIPHYRLLLEDYLNHIEKDCEEYQNTEVALNIVKDVLHHANSSLKLADNFCKLLQIQSNVGSYEIIKPGRLFVKEGELKKLSRKDTQPRFIILLSDCLLYAIFTTSATGFKIKYELPLSGMKVHTHPGDGTEFSIITSTRSFTLRTRNDAECNEWVSVLRRTINENITRQLTFLNKSCNDINNSNFESLKLGREAPVWVQDKSTTMCQVCTAEFTVTFRRHHCRCCGKVVCGDCSSNKAPLAYQKFQVARVCEECYNYLLKEFDDSQANMFEVVKNELNLSDQDVEGTIENIKSAFKKMDSVKKNKKYIPQRLKEVMANDRGSSMSGWLSRKQKKEWKRLWFVLKDQVLYMYKASNDVVAYDSLPVLGYVVDQPLDEEDLDTALSFRLTHANQMPVIFLAPDKKSADLWVAALTEATVLK